MVEELREFKDLVLSKLDSFDRRLTLGLQEVQLTAGRRIPSQPNEESSDLTRPRDGHVVVAPGSASATGLSNIQGDFAALKDSLARVKLPTELKLNESRQGIKRSDQPVLNVVTRTSRYSETAAKLLSTIEPGEPISQETLDQLFLIYHAQCKYLQDEYAALLVNSQFDNSTLRLFRTLQKNTSGLNAESLETLRSAASLVAVSQPNRPQRGGFQTYNRGRGRGGNNRRSDVFDGFAQRGFPQKRYNRDDNRAVTAPTED